MLQADSAAKVINSEINNEYYGSDHCPLSLTISCNEGGSKSIVQSIEIKEADEKAPVKEMMKPSVPAPKIEEKKILAKRPASVD
jgi:hypothetical protein